jgi:glutamate---cysteine ligase / carboxylate-amine ligase
MVAPVDTSPVRPAPPTVGVEEELTLVDPRSGRVALRAPDAIRDCGDPEGVVAESMTFMVETRTPVCRTLAEVHRALQRGRRAVADAARRRGAVALATGLAPYGMPDPPAVTEDPRYLELARRFPFAMSTNGTCGCHVHVAVPSRQAGVEVLLRLRPWLPALVALTANSPICDGRDAGWASHRLVLASRWPTAVPAPPVGTVAEYDDLLSAAVSSGEALDVRSVYFLARLSPRYPTVETRVADVCLTAEETLCYAGLVRALVARALDEARLGRPADPVPQEVLRASCAAAARTGLSDSWELVDRLVAAVRPQLRAHGDEALVVATLDRLRAVGGGAERQRRLFGAAASPEAFVAALADATLAGLGPRTLRR